LDVKKRYTEEQIIGFLQEAEAGLSVKELCRRQASSTMSCAGRAGIHTDNSA